MPQQHAPPLRTGRSAHQRQLELGVTKRLAAQASRREQQHALHALLLAGVACQPHRKLAPGFACGWVGRASWCSLGSAEYIPGSSHGRPQTTEPSPTRTCQGTSGFLVSASSIMRSRVSQLTLEEEERGLPSCGGAGVAEKERRMSLFACKLAAAAACCH